MKLPQVEAQLLNVFGYIKTIWKNSEFVRGQDNMGDSSFRGIKSTIDSQYQKGKTINTAKSMINVVSTFPSKTMTINNIPSRKTITGHNELDNQITSNINESPKKSIRTTSGVINKKFNKISSPKIDSDNKPFKEIRKEERKSIANTKRQQIIDKIVKRIPNLDFILSKTLIKK